MKTTMQEAAQAVLHELGRPASAREIARRALERGLVTSNARAPILSMAQTLEKSIRDGIYNHPRLVFIQNGRERLVGLPGQEVSPLGSGREPRPAEEFVEVRALVPRDLVRKITLAEQAGVQPSFDATVALILKKGLAEIGPEIRNGLLREIESLEQLAH
jgi:hypothetical protein